MYVGAMKAFLVGSVMCVANAQCTADEMDLCNGTPAGGTTGGTTGGTSGDTTDTDGQVSMATRTSSKFSVAIAVAMSAMASSSKSHSLLPLSVILALPGSEGLTCGDVKEGYRSEECCGQPDQTFNEDMALYPNAEDCVTFGFNLVDLTAEESEGITEPEDSCFMPVTLQALLDSGHQRYTWVHQSNTNANAAHGAYAYKMSDGTTLYKNIVPTDDNPTLQFGCARPLPRLTTFADASNLGTAMSCTSGPVSITDPPFNSYSHYGWVQLEGQACGSFVYQVASGGHLVHHTCG